MDTVDLLKFGEGKRTYIKYISFNSSYMKHYVA